MSANKILSPQEERILAEIEHKNIAPKHHNRAYDILLHQAMEMMTHILMLLASVLTVKHKNLHINMATN